MSTSSERAARSPRARQAVAVRGSGPVLGWLLFAGCSREPEDLICPDVGPGDFVITEIRSNSGSSLPNWLEIANVSGADVQLEGLRVEVQQLDGSSLVELVVRYKRTAPADEYYVLGLIEDTEIRDGVDYGFGQTPGTFFEDGRITMSSCGETIDEVTYVDLPPEGSWSLGATPPSAEANDDPAAWCVDKAEVPGTNTDVGVPGSPGEENRPCE